MAEALLTNRDGIVGAPLMLDPEFRPGIPNDPRNLERLSPQVRASIFMFELGTRVTFTASGGDAPTAQLWRLDQTEGALPTIDIRPLVSITAPSIDQLKEQMGYLTAYADLRQDRGAEILAQLSAPTPFLASIVYMDPARTPHTLELLGAALRFANYNYMRIKYSLAVKRPIEFSPQVQPMIPTPTHASLPSGHATEAFLLSRLLWKILRASQVPQYRQDCVWGEMLMRQAARIATNRTIAGVHFPVDSVAGAVLGLTLADFIHEFCVAEPVAGTKATFIGPKFDAADDLDWHQLYDVRDDRQCRESVSNGKVWATAEPGGVSPGTVKSPPLIWLWDKAVAEWRDFAPE